MVKFGMPSLFEADSVESAAALCGELDLSFVELNANFPPFQNLEAAELKRAARDNGVFFTIHLDDGLNVADFNPLVAEAYCQTVEHTLALAGEAEIPTLNMHLPRGAVYTLPSGKVYFAQRYQETYLDAVRRFRDRCDRWSVSGVRLCVENSDSFLDVQRKAIDLLLESPVFGLTLDIGHDHCSGGLDRPFILARKDRLCHMHMHDARLPQFDHLPLGQGELDIPAFLKLADSVDATVVLEVKTEEGLRKSVQWLNR